MNPLQRLYARFYNFRSIILFGFVGLPFLLLLLPSLIPVDHPTQEVLTALGFFSWGMLGALMVYTRDTLTHRKFISGAQWEGVGCGIAEMWFFWSLVSYGLFKTFLPRYWPGAMPLIPPGILAFITTGMVYSQRTRKVALIAILTIAVAASIRFLILPFFSGS